MAVVGDPVKRYTVIPLEEPITAPEGPVRQPEKKPPVREPVKEPA